MKIDGCSVDSKAREISEVFSEARKSLVARLALPGLLVNELNQDFCAAMVGREESRERIKVLYHGSSNPDGQGRAE